jgi:hypothetical protein
MQVFKIKTYFKKVPFKIQNFSDVHAASRVEVTKYENERN